MYNLIKMIRVTVIMDNFMITNHIQLCGTYFCLYLNDLVHETIMLSLLHSAGILNLSSSFAPC